MPGFFDWCGETKGYEIIPSSSGPPTAIPRSRCHVHAMLLLIGGGTGTFAGIMLSGKDGPIGFGVIFAIISAISLYYGCGCEGAISYVCSGRDKDVERGQRPGSVR